MLKINISRTIAGHWLIYARVLCNALHFIIFSGGVMLHTPCFTPVYVNRSHLNKHNKLKYERNSGGNITRSKIRLCSHYRAY